MAQKMKVKRKQPVTKMKKKGVGRRIERKPKVKIKVK